MQPENKTKKLDWWVIVLFFLNVLYLSAEFVFNAKLLNTASSLNIDPVELHRVELFGRSVSGAGFALFVVGIMRWLSDKTAGWKSFAGVSFVISCLSLFAYDLPGYFFWFIVAVLAGGMTLYGIFTQKNIFAVVGAAVFAWTCMFAGQKIAIEHFLIEPSNAEIRLTAQYMSLLKAGLAKDYLHLNGIPSINDGSPEQKTFMALLGSLAMKTPEFLGLVKSKETDLISLLQETIAQEELPKQYAEYRTKGDAFYQQYLAYQEKAHVYEDALAGSGNKAREQYTEMLNQAAQGYERYQRGERDFINSMHVGAKRLASTLNDYSNTMGICDNYGSNYEGANRCREQTNQTYERISMSTFHKYIPLTYWCEPSNNAVSNTVDTVVNGINKLFWGKQHQEQHTVNCYNVPLDKLEKKLALQNEGEFKARSGYPLGIESQEKFMAYGETSARARNELRQRGVIVPLTWRITDATTFMAAVKKRIEDEAGRQWRAKVLELAGGYIPPSLTYAEFVQQPVVQDKIKTAMGDAYVTGMTFEFSEREFMDRIVEPSVLRKIKYELDQFQNRSQEFANGKPREEEGKKYLRSVLIPPISLFLSLFFALISIGKLATTPLKAIPSIGNRTVVLWFVIIATVIVAPFFVPNEFSDSRAFVYFTGQTMKTYPVSTLTSKWTIRMQPVMFHVGERLRVLMEDRLLKH